MLYESTRGSKNKKTSAQAIISGIAEDKGLYVPESIPKLPLKPEAMVGMAYGEIAKLILLAYFDDFTEEEMDCCVNSAYDSKFTASDICELREAGGKYFLELYHGKTAAFKDMALSILPYLLTTAMKKEGVKEKVCILTATSGDTGKAALEGFSGAEGTEIIVFYPEGGVSEVQRRQMITTSGENTHVYAIRGNFDDCQTEVKKIFSDAEIRSRLKEKGIIFSSANSINIGRLVPQVAYYVYAYVKLLERGAVKAGEKINIAVPTGNFGNILAAYMAKEMGLPVNMLICASNDNRVLTDFLSTGLYDIRKDRRDFILTNSPSMDILISSNLERLLYLLNGRDAELVSDWMSSLDEMGMYIVMDSIKLMDGLKAFHGGFSTEEETLKEIARSIGEDSYLMDTHTAVASKVSRKYSEETGDDAPMLVVSTASAFKFAEAVNSAIGIEKSASGFEAVKKLSQKTGEEVPQGLRDLDKKAVIHDKTGDIKNMAELVLSSI